MSFTLYSIGAPGTYPLGVGGTVAGGIATIAGALVWLGRSVSSLSGVTDSIVDVLGNPLLWLGLAALALAVDWRSQRRSRAQGAGPTPG